MLMTQLRPTARVHRLPKQSAWLIPEENGPVDSSHVRVAVSQVAFEFVYVIDPSCTPLSVLAIDRPDP
jgi:hypothetical protein